MKLSKKMRTLCLSTAVSGLMVFGIGTAFAQDQLEHAVDTLRDAVAVGVATNPEYGMVAASRRATDEELTQGKALFLPSIDLSGDAGNGRQHAIPPGTGR